MSVKLDVSLFKKMITACKQAVSTEKKENRAYLRYINIDVKDGILKMWSVNGYNIQIEELEVHSKESFKAKLSQLYIPPNDIEVLLERANDVLEITFLPSKFKMSIPQDDTLQTFDLDNFINTQTKKNYKVCFTKEFLEKALKSAAKRDKIIFEINTETNVQPVLIRNTERTIKSTSYVMPVRIRE